MKKHAFPVLISGVAIAASATYVTAAQSGAAQPSAGQTSAAQAATRLSRAQLNSLVTANLDSCKTKVPVIPREGMRTIAPERVAKALHGIWRGRVWGDYPKELLAADGFLNVDYYWLIDAERGESLILEQLSSKRAAPSPPVHRAQVVEGYRGTLASPVWSFLSCGREGYVPRHPKQVHEFQKISNSLDGARAMLETSTGLKAVGQDVSLSAAWKRLVEDKYFDTARFGAFAGGLFKPFEIVHSTNAAGTPVLTLSYQAEYRGGGATAARFESGVPILGRETAGFVVVDSPQGYFLVSSLENGVEWEKVAAEAGTINMTMDKVVIGPLAP